MERIPKTTGERRTIRDGDGGHLGTKKRDSCIPIRILLAFFLLAPQSTVMMMTMVGPRLRDPAWHFNATKSSHFLTIPVITNELVA